MTCLGHIKERGKLKYFEKRSLDWRQVLYKHTDMFIKPVTEKLMSGGGAAAKCKLMYEIYVQTLWLMADGSGLYRQEFSRGTGQINIYKIMIQNGEFITAEAPEYQFTMGDADNTAFTSTNEKPEWIDINN